jgi:hypothetical protein
MAFPGRPLLSKMAGMENAPGGFFQNILWRAARQAAQRGAQPAPAAPAAGQGTQQFGAAMPFQGGSGSFFRRKGI